MPKISAPTVVEQRAIQRSGILSAAADLLVEGGVPALSPAAVAQRAGMARSNVYRYFDSMAALLATVVEEAYPLACSVVADELKGAGTPYLRVEAFLGATLSMAADGRFRMIGALARVDLPAMCRERVDELDATYAEPLRIALRELDPSTADLRAELVLGALFAGVRRVEAATSSLGGQYSAPIRGQQDASEVQREIVALFLTGIAAAKAADLGAAPLRAGRL